jgi:hypothetical protein
MHDTFGMVGLGLLRLEMVERTWWTDPSICSVEEWNGGERARLTTRMDGVEYGVFVGKGEAFAASLEQAA